MKHQTREIRIYVACLAAYNNGILHGCWINADQDKEDIYHSIRAMLAASPIKGAEEYAIHDYEGFEGIQIEEYSGIEKVAEYAAFIAEHGALGGKLIAYYDDLEVAKASIEEFYQGCYPSMADFARELTEEMHLISGDLAYYIDYEAMARDLEINDYLTFEADNGHVHIFWQH